jgi:hypothetical protein
VTKALVHKVLKWATEDIDNPDLRDRGFMYWRMLAMNPSVAAEIVLAEKPAITTDSDRMDRGALDQLLLHTGTLGSIYHKNPEVTAPGIFRSSLQLMLRLQTFIRNSAGRELVDSPALNANSRAVLVSLTRPLLPSTAISVPGPGPIEPTRPSLQPDESANKAPQPILVESTRSDERDLLDIEGDDGVVGDSGDGYPDGDDDVGVVKAADPYAELGGAFGGYMTDHDGPQPVGGGRSRGGDLDDLLF